MLTPGYRSGHRWGELSIRRPARDDGSTGGGRVGRRSDRPTYAARRPAPQVTGGQGRHARAGRLGDPRPESKISRMELGRVGFKERDVADLLTLYGVADHGE